MTPSVVHNELASQPLPPRDTERTHKTRMRLRILHVIPQFMPGGTEYTLLRLIRGLGEEEFEHRICATRAIDAQFAAQQGMTEKLFLAANGNGGAQFPFFRLGRIMRAFRPHIVHSRNWGGVEAIPAARVAGVPVAIHSEHGYEVDSLAGLPLRRRVFRRAAYALADAVFTNSEELRQYHARQAWVPSVRLRVVYNGVDTLRFAPRPAVRVRMRQELALSPDSVVIGSVGRLVTIKDHLTLLKAASALIRQGVNVRVVLVGTGPQAEILQNYAADDLKLADRVVFTGASDNIPDLLNGMDIFVLPSLGEGMSNTVLEAMASALPVVATRVGGNPELVEEGRTGFLFAPGDVQSLVAHIQTLSNNISLRQEISAAARDRIVSLFSLEHMIAEYRNLYRDLALQRRLESLERGGVLKTQVAGDRTT
jgi:sugar transferase (PEP-CTERM/EpsH1 system associated)